MSRFAERGSQVFPSVSEDDSVGGLVRFSEDSELFGELPLNRVEATPQDEDILREEDSQNIEYLEENAALPPSIRRRQMIPAELRSRQTSNVESSREFSDSEDELFEPLFSYRPPPMIAYRRMRAIPADEIGLSSDRVERFSLFNADEKSVDDGCAICIDGVEINKLMIRLDCNHFNCSGCISNGVKRTPLVLCVERSIAIDLRFLLLVSYISLYFVLRI